MTKITHPYFMLVLIAVASAAMAVAIAQRRERLHNIRLKQELAIAEIITYNKKANYLMRKRHELLSNPATIAEIAKEQYGFIWEGREFLQLGRNQQQIKDQKIKIVENGWERFLGQGDYIWKLPVGLAGICAALFAILSFFDNKTPQISLRKENPN